MKKDITYIEAGKLETLIAQSGLEVKDKKGWTRVDGAAGRRLYVPKTKRVGRVDLVGLSGQGTRQLGDDERHGSVTHQLDMTRDEAAILATFERLLGELATAPAVERPAKAPRAPKAVPTAGKPGRVELIRKVAEQRGLTAQADEGDDAIPALDAE